MALERTIFIGDIHGCAREFDALLQRLDWDAERDRLLLTGDAFTRGPNPHSVWKMIQDTGAEMVRGNHEQRLLGWLPQSLGGKGTGEQNAARRKFMEAVGGDVEPMLDWIKRLPLWIESSHWLLVHAGVHPTAGLAGSTPEQMLAIRTWPPRNGILGRRWHDHLVPPEKTIIFGHDAPRRLILKRRHDRTAYVVGLDTGCVYGGCLTGYVFEEDRIVQVPACT